MTAPRNMFPLPSAPEFALFGFDVPLTMIEFMPLLTAFALGLIVRKANAFGIAIILAAILAYWAATQNWLLWLEVGRAGPHRFSIDGALWSAAFIGFYLAFIAGTLVSYASRRIVILWTSRDGSGREATPE